MVYTRERNKSTKSLWTAIEKMMVEDLDVMPKHVKQILVNMTSSIPIIMHK
uniref:Uncharacterized protein n=1 Tax=Arion vulgaris TaxID=1028688 RepID=A0A0B7BDK1_9EUPU